MNTVVPTVSEIKIRAARASLFAALFLTVTKAIVASRTHSLGILTEVMHSGVDFLAAALTLYAVSHSSLAPDERYPFGRKKLENLVALAELGLLVATAFYALNEAFHRIYQGHSPAHPTWDAFLVMIVAIGIDSVRARELRRIGEANASHALVADALHFENDILTSLTVIMGLALSGFGITMADPIAAVAVAVLILKESFKMTGETVAALLDRAPEGLEDEIRALAATVPGVLVVKRVRVRAGGGRDQFVDLVVAVDPNLSLTQSHVIAEAVERTLGERFPDSDTVVHLDPGDQPEARLAEVIALLRPDFQGLEGLHDVTTFTGRDGLEVICHLEIRPDVSLSEAHRLATSFEAAAAKALGGAQVHTHLDLAGADGFNCRELERRGAELVARSEEIALTVPGISAAGPVRFSRVGDEIYLSLSVTTTHDLPLVDAHELGETVELALRRQFRNLRNVVVHIEPPGAHESSVLQEKK